MQHNTTAPTQGQREKAVFRSLAIPVSAFDHIKDTQRAIQASTGLAIGLNDTVAHIVRQHKQLTQTAATEEQTHANVRNNRTPAILRAH